MRGLTRASVRGSAMAAIAQVKNITPHRVIPKGFALSVFNEETKTMMEVKQLLNHKNPNIRKLWRTMQATKFGRLMNRIRGRVE